MKAKRLHLILAAVLGILAVGCVPLLPQFQLRMITEIVIFALLTESWRVLFHDAGLLSFGHAVYFGLGAYASALALIHIGHLSFLNAILLGGIFSGIIGFILGVFLVRMTGTYFSLLTLAFNQLIWAVCWKWRDVTGGDDGLGNFPKPDILGISMRNPVHFYYSVLIIVSVCLLTLWYFRKTPLGSVILCIKDNEKRAGYIGLNVKASKLILFTMASFYAGIAGALYAQLQEFISTGSMDLWASGDIIFRSYIGGTGYFSGSVVGSGVFVYLSEYLSSFTSHWEFFFGAFFVIVVLFAPRGAMEIVYRGLGGPLKSRKVVGEGPISMQSTKSSLNINE